MGGEEIILMVPIEMRFFLCGLSQKNVSLSTQDGYKMKEERCLNASWFPVQKSFHTNLIKCILP